MISVIVCTHNPREDYLQRTIEALKNQTLSRDLWELLLIDNHSTPPLRQRVDLSWHLLARIIEEPELGLTPARFCGIQEARGDLLVFVDDDNVVDANFLEVAREIAAKHSCIGAFGGVIVPEFEIAPHPESRRLWHNLAVREPQGDRWANFYLPMGPCGAGLCVRKPIALMYMKTARECPIRKQLDRRGQSLAGGGDEDLVLTALDVGQGIGSFESLRMTHLIPSRRCDLDYLLRLEESLACSSELLSYARSAGPRSSPGVGRTFKRRTFDKLIGLAELFLSSRLERQRFKGRQRGVAQARAIIREFEKGS
jgi:glycosyltransferase involved in cell wall biosynthesis